MDKVISICFVYFSNFISPGRKDEVRLFELKKAPLSIPGELEIHSFIDVLPRP